MKKHIMRALLGLALAAPVTAFAAPADHNGHPGHYEWRSLPQFSPRTPGPVQQQIWVPDAAQTASCDCAMMAMGSDKAADCMARKQSMGSSLSSRRSA
ncbi:MAG: hypothetical protein KGJ57_21325 [Sphingomonadales bacterium]|nr:hypothetical protein [Sphingomonadales bacterium]MDE2171935.1 hypothetical protein [Sphingomonadales bacterium]